MTSLNPVLTIGLQLTETMMLHLGLGRPEADRRAVELLGMVGIGEPERRLKQYPAPLQRGHAPARHDRAGPLVQP